MFRQRKSTHSSLIFCWSVYIVVLSSLYTYKNCIIIFFCLLFSSWPLFTEVLIPLENETTILEGEGHFFCQLQGNEEKLRIGGRLTSVPHNSPNDLIINVTEIPTENSTRVINISITITAWIKYNNSEVECYDKIMDRSKASKATLIIQGVSS